jgi:hypothetical protein
MIAIPKARTRSRLNPVESPSPAMIRRRAASIQKSWSYRTRLKRSGQASDLVGLVEISSAPRRKGYQVE